MSKLVSYSKLFTLFSPNIIIDGHEIKIYENKRGEFSDIYGMRQAFMCPILMTFDKNDELYLVNNNNELYRIKMAIFPRYKIYLYSFIDTEEKTFDYSFDSPVEFLDSFGQFLDIVTVDFRTINSVGNV